MGCWGLKRSYTRTPSAAAMCSSVTIVGFAFPVSISEITAWRNSPAAAASCSWLQPLRMRSLLTL